MSSHPKKQKIPPSTRKLGGRDGLLLKARSGRLTREQLSQMASVSPRTIARIEKNQERKARSEVIARLAVALAKAGADVDLREWMEAGGAGDAYDDDLERRIKITLDQENSDRSRSIIFDVQKPDTLKRLREGKEVSCFVLNYGAGSDPGSYFTDFLNKYLVLLFSLAGRGRWKYRIKLLNSFAERFKEAHDKNEDWGITLGLLKTEGRRELGIVFLPIPGWSFRLNAVYDQSSMHGDRCSISWDEIEENLTKDPDDRLVAIAAKEEASACYLREVCNYKDELIEINVFEEEEFFRKYEKVKKNESRKIVIVGDELMCIKIIAKHRDFRLVRPFGRHSMKLKNLPAQFRGSGLPRYDLSLALVAGDGELLERLKETQETMFQAAGWKLADIYSTLISQLYLAYREVDLRVVDDKGVTRLLEDWIFDSSFICPTGLEKDRYTIFRAVLAERLYNKLQEKLPRQSVDEISVIVQHLLTSWRHETQNHRKSK